MSEFSGQEQCQLVHRRRYWFEALLPPALIVLAGIAVYANSLQGEFVLDDLVAIQGNTTIRHLSPLGHVLFPPREVVGEGNTVEGRPLLNLSFALNYAAGGLDVRGYHAVNLAIHLLAALLLFGIVRRTLLQPKIRKHVGNAAPWLALVVALIWTVHPLQTESVTYVAQRAESLMGLFFLLTMYLSIRGFEVSRSFWWQTSAVASCVLGMAAKEVMATVPLMVLLYDVAFVTGSWRAAWNARWKFYVCLMLLGWGTLAALLLVAGGSNLGNVQALLGQLGGQEGAARGGHEVHWLDYARMQCWAVARYVRLCFWPNPLIFYYGKDMAKNIWSVLPSALAVALLLASAVAAWRRRSWMGFAGAWFFLILAPTSSIVPLSGQTVAEHRMYLPLAAVVSLMVIGSYVLFQKLAPSCSNDSGHRRGMTLRGGGFVIVLLLLLTLGGLTIARNADYRTRFSIWHDTVKKWPTNPVAHNNLAEVLLQKGQLDEAKSHCETALDLNPDYPEAHNNLGVAHLRLGDPREAAVQFQKAIELKPKYAGAYSNLGSALLLQGKMAEAMDHFQKALQLNPAKADARINLGHALLHLGKKDEAIEHLQMALEAEPDHAEAHNNLGEALRETGKLDAAMEHLNTALKLRPNYADARINLGSMYYQTGREKEAVVQFDEAVKLNPKAISALNNLSWILAVSSNETLRNPARALELAQRANELTGGNHPTILQTLAAVYAANGRFVEADETAEKALFLANSQGNGALVDLIRVARRYYQAGKPLPPAPSATTGAPSAARSDP